MNYFHRRFFRIVSPAFVFFFFLIITPSPVLALDNGLARTPPMGWNSWNVFHIKISDTLFREIADKLVSTGLAKAGYRYLCIDGGWNIDSNYSQHDPAKFPNGIKPVADYAHNLGLKLGIYTNWSSRNHETRDASAWASWGIDYVKHDSWKQYSTDTTIWITMRDAILATKRPMVYSVHFQDRSKVIGNPKIMNMWRFTNDLVPYYNRAKLPANLNWGVTTVDIIDTMARVAASTGPGCWADADMLMVEVGNQTVDEWKTAFAASCILPSPLILSTDIRNSPQPILDIFLNTELIAVNQDTLSSKSWKVRDNGLRDVWARRLGDSSFAVVFFNMDAAAAMQVGWNELKNESGKALVRDLWQKKDIGTFSNSYSVTVPTHGTAFLKITPERFITHVRPENRSAHPGTVQPKAIVRVLDGTIRIALTGFTGTPLTVRYTLSTLSGKKISENEWSMEPEHKNEKSVNIPADCRTGMYVISIATENSAMKIHEEIQTKVFIVE